MIQLFHACSHLWNDIVCCLSLIVILLYCMFPALKADDSESFKTMVQFECRGLEPVDFQPQVS